MIDPGPSYGFWLFAFINSAVFILFAFSFFKPQTSRDWRSFGAFSAFIVAGVGPAAIGGVLYGWVLYGRRPFNAKEEEYSK